MLQGIYKALIMMIGRGLISLAYGTEGMNARKKLNKDGADGFLSFILSGVVCVWILCFVLNDGSAGLLAYLYAVPVIYVVFFFFARRASKRYIEEAEKPTHSDSIKSEVVKSN